MPYDLDEYRKKREIAISELEAWETLIGLDEGHIMIIMRVDGKLRCSVQRADRFIPEIQT